MKYVVAGFGHFGRLALGRLRAAFSDAEIVVVEKNIDRAMHERYERAKLVEGDAVAFLVESSSLGAEDVIIPMVPFHLAASYLLARHQDLRRVALPHGIEEFAPNPYRLDDSTICFSMADFLCPDACPEAEVCTVTGERREKPLYLMLAESRAPGFTSVALRSLQILPGIGGYFMADLRKLSKKIEHGKYIVATSCRCHGIMTGIERRPL